MVQEKVTVVAQFKAKKGKEEQARQVLMSLVAPTRVEAGCVDYVLHQDPKDKTRFLFYENWTSQAALDQHMKTPQLQKLVAVVEELFAEPIDVSKWAIIG